MSGYPGPGYNGQNYQGFAQGYPPQQQGGYYPPPQGGYGGYREHEQLPQQGYPAGPGDQQSGYGAQPGGYHPPPPPQETQQFAHGAPAEYTFKYSNCTGKRKALLIGINYYGQNGQLAGCINDVRNIKQFLIDFYHYSIDDMVVLVDDARDEICMPTHKNIKRAMCWLVDGAAPNDSLFFHYSGHGGQVEDRDGDEDDGFDEAIYPVDFANKKKPEDPNDDELIGPIVDDDIHAIMVSPLPPGTRLTAIFDSCHSGSALDLPYVYSTQGVLKEPNLAKEAGMGLLGAMAAYAQGDIGRATGSIFDVAKRAMSGNSAHEKTKRTKTSPADVISLSGSKDDQTSADTTIDSQATGAMSYAFRSALTAEPEQSYVELLNNIRNILREKYSQKPQLSCSHPLDTNLRFVM